MTPVVLYCASSVGMNWSSAFNNNDNKRKQQLYDMFAFVVSSEWVDLRACVRVHVCVCVCVGGGGVQIKIFTRRSVRDTHGCVWLSVQSLSDPICRNPAIQRQQEHCWKAASSGPLNSYMAVR